MKNPMFGSLSDFYQLNAQFHPDLLWCCCCTRTWRDCRKFFCVASLICGFLDSIIFIWATEIRDVGLRRGLKKTYSEHVKSKLYIVLFGMLIPAISGDLVLTQTCFGGVNIVKIYQNLNSTDFALNMKSLAPICCWMLGSEPNWHLLRRHASQSGINNSVLGWKFTKSMNFLWVHSCHSYTH